MQWTSASSNASDWRQAVADVAHSIRRDFRGEAPDVLFCFVDASAGAPPESLPAFLSEHLAPGELIGCTSSGLLGPEGPMMTGPGLVAMAGRFQGVRARGFHLSTVVLPDADAPPDAWRAMVEEPEAEPGAIVLLADPRYAHIEPMLAGLDYAFPGAMKVGGLAGGRLREPDWSVFRGGNVYRRGVVGLLLSGNIRADGLLSRGCREVGPPMTITRSRGNLLHELDGRPAIEAVESIASMLPAEERRILRRRLCIGMQLQPIHAPRARGHFLIRNLLGLDYKSGAIVLAALPEEGQVVQFHVRDSALARRDLEEGLQRAGGPGGGRAAALSFICLARRAGAAAGGTGDGELLRAAFPGAAVGGCFCNGEIGPVGGTTCLHGYTSAHLFLSAAGETLA